MGFGQAGVIGGLGRVDRRLVAAGAGRGQRGRLCGGTVVVVLDQAVAVLVLPVQQSRGLPIAHPGQVLAGLDVGQRHGGLAEGLALRGARPHGRGQVEARHRTHRRSDGIEQRDEDQRPACRLAGIGHLGHGEEADDHVRQTRGADHQRHREQDHVQGRVVVFGIGAEAQVGHQTVQLRQERHARSLMRAEQAQGRQEVARQLQRDEHRRDGIGDDQHDVLCDLRVGDALHAAKNGIAEHQRRADPQAGRVRHLEIAREGDAHAGHLADHVGDRDDQQTDHADDPRGARIETVADEFRHGELAELAQIGRQQQGQQHVAARPAHQVGRVVIAREGDQTRHRDEGRGRHPVGGRRHAVHDRSDAAVGGIELGRGFRPAIDGDADIQRERGADDQQVQGELAHGWVLTRPRRVRRPGDSCARCRRRSAR